MAQDMNARNIVFWALLYENIGGTTDSINRIEIIMERIIRSFIFESKHATDFNKIMSAKLQRLPVLFNRIFQNIKK